MIFGVVLYEHELILHEKSDNIEYINVKDMSYRLTLRECPVLVIGWSLIKKINENQHNIDVLEKTVVSGRLFWEFSFEENKSAYVNGIDGFVKSAPVIYFKNYYKYCPIDPVFNNLITVEDFIGSIPERVDFVYNYKNEFIYLKSDTLIFGYDLRMFNFFEYENDFLITTFVNLVDPENYFIDIEGLIYKKIFIEYIGSVCLKKYMCIFLEKKEF